MQNPVSSMFQVSSSAIPRSVRTAQYASKYVVIDLMLCVLSFSAARGFCLRLKNNGCRSTKRLVYNAPTLGGGTDGSKWLCSNR